MGNKNRDSECGSGTILILALTLLLLIGVVVATVLSGAYAYRVRVQAVADLAALSGGDASASGQWENVGNQPCDAAQRITHANAMVMVSCSVKGSDTYVVVKDERKNDFLPFTVTARARAGPE